MNYINQNNLQPIYDTTASIGIAYSIYSTIIGTILSILIIILGIWIKNMNSDKTGYANGIVKDVTDYDYKATSCISTIYFKVKDTKDTVKTATGIGNKGQNIGVYYDPSNPNNFTTNNYSYIIGWIMIIIGSLILLSVWVWFIFTLIFKPVAAVTGVGAVTNAVVPDF